MKQSKYSFSDILLFWVYSNLCGATRLESCTSLKNNLQNIPSFQTPSPDRLAGVFKTLSIPKEIEVSQNEITHEFCYNPKMVELMLDIAKRLKMITCDTLDYDNVVIDTEKYDTAHTYKSTKGYQPAVAFMGQTPVYIEGRNGNTGASYKMGNAIRECLNNLERKKIPVRNFRSDSASYQHEVINLLESKNIDFFIRMKKSPKLKRRINLIQNWEKTTYANKNIEIAEMPYVPFRTLGNTKRFRVIVKRERVDGKIKDYAIITNNRNLNPEDILYMYNNRANMERNFDDLKNNFNWRRLPFSFMNENLVFMIMGGIASIVYRYIIKSFGKKLPFIKHSFRLKKFIADFILIGSEWIDGILRLYDFNNRNYSLLSG